MDLAPTFLDIAGIKPPAHMDGRSLLPLLKGTRSGQDKVENWRDTFLVERLVCGHKFYLALYSVKIILTEEDMIKFESWFKDCFEFC